MNVRFFAIAVTAVVVTGCAGQKTIPGATEAPSYTVLRHPVTLATSLGEKRVRPNATIYLGSVQTIAAILQSPNALAYDPDDGSLYVLDKNLSNAIVLRVSPDNGATSVFATLPVSKANGIAYAHANKTFYVTSQQGQSGGYPSIFSVSGTGAVSTLAGGTTSGSQDGTGAAASFLNPGGIAYDAHDGNVYVADENSVRRVTTAGVVKTIATGFGSGFGVQPTQGLAYNAYDTNLYLASPAQNLVQRITTAGAVTTIAGQCLTNQGTLLGCDSLQRDGHGTAALFAGPIGIVANPADGSLYVADSYNNSIRKIDRNFNVTTLAGNGLSQNVDGAGLNAEFDQPVGITLTPGSAKLYIVDNDTNSNKVALRSVTSSGSTPPPLNTPITLFDTLTPDAIPFAIDWHASSPSSSGLWYTERTHRLAQITTTGQSTEYSFPYDPFDTVLGGDGTPWIFDATSSKIVHRNETGTYTAYAVNQQLFNNFATPDMLAYAPNGNIWFTTTGGSPNEFTVGYITSAGAVTQFAVTNYRPSWTGRLTIDSLGNAWYTDGNTGILRFSPTGTITHYGYPGAYLTKGPDGNIWFTESDAVGTIKPGGIIVQYPIYQAVPGCTYNGGCSRYIGAITAGPDGALWFAEGYGAIGRMTTSGVLTEYQVYAARRSPNDITDGPDGNIWFVDEGAQKIGRLKIH